MVSQTDSSIDISTHLSNFGQTGWLNWLLMQGGSCRPQGASSTSSATTCTLDLSAKVLTTSKTLSHKKCFLPGPTWKPLTSCEGDYLRFYSPPMPSVTKTEAQDRLKDRKVLISNNLELRFDERFCWTNKANFTFGLSDQLFVQFRSHSLLFTGFWPIG